MKEVDDDWRSDIDDVDAALLDDYQSGFPIVERPFDALGERLEVGGDEAFDRVRSLHERGLIRRFGPVLNPPVIGSSTLAAVSVPNDEFDDAVAVVNGYHQVNHNYRRDHEWNMWFVLTASSRERRDELIGEIEAETGRDVLVLPKLTDYCITLDFPVVNEDRFANESAEPVGSPTQIPESAGELTTFEAALLLEIQAGFPLSKTPYRDVAATLDADVSDVLETTGDLLERGCIKRIGFVVNHGLTGFDANCMVAWDVPDDRLDELGEAVAAKPYVTKCYHRPRRPELGWEYNLFTMVHGREEDAVEVSVDELAEEYLPYPHERLYTAEKLKQTGARYEELLVSGE